MFLVTLIFLDLWVLEALGYYSLGTPIFAPHQYPYQHFDIPGTIYALFVVHVFYLLWIIFFLVHTSDFLICGTAASWYFQRPTPYC